MSKYLDNLWVFPPLEDSNKMDKIGGKDSSMAFKAKKEVITYSGALLQVPPPKVVHLDPLTSVHRAIVT